MGTIGSQKHLFEIPEDVTYLNCAYMAPQLRSVTEAGISGVQRKKEPWRVTAADFFSEIEEVRALFAQIAGGDSDGVAILPSVSYGLATAAANAGLTAGDRIVILAEQFPSNVLVWREAAAATGAEVVTVPRPADGDWTTGVEEAVDERTKVIAVPNCHWTDGSVVDLVRVGELARSVDALFAVDATQSLGALPLDVARVQPDFLFAAAYKWLLGPYSLAYAWVAPERRDGQPIEHSWMAREDSEDFARLVDYRDTYRPGARRFDVGETSNFALMPMGRAALTQLLEWGVDRIASSLASTTRLIAEEAERIGLKVPAEASRAPHMIGLGLPEGAPRDLLERLAAQKVFVSVRGNSIRVSPHLYNDEGDVKRLMEQLSAL